MHPDLYAPFVKRNVAWIALFALVVIVGFPCEGIILPVQYSRLTSAQDKKRVLYLIFGLWVVVTGLYIARETIHLKLFPSYVTYLRQTMYKSVVDDFSLSEDNASSFVDTARIITRINKLSEVTGEFAEWTMRDPFPLTVALLVINGFVYVKSPAGGAIMTTGMAIMLGASVLLGKHVVDKNAERERAFLSASNHMNDKFDNIENIVYAAREDHEYKSMKEKNGQYETDTRSSLVNARNLKAVTIGLSVVTFVAVLLVALKKMKSTPAVFLGLTLVMVYFLNWTLALFHSVPQSLAWLAAIRVNNDYFAKMFGKVDKGKRRVDFSKDIQFQNVTYAYNTKKTVLKDFSLVFPAKKTTVVYGRSGSGKTTILKLILKKLIPQKGTITVGNVSLQDVHRQTLRSNVGFSNQNTILFDDTIRENFRYGNGATDKEIDAFVKKYDVGALFKNGIDVSAGKNGLHSSKGMQKIVSIARVLLNKKTPIMIFDEPFAGLDEKTQTRVLKMLREGTAKKTVVIISHQEITKQLADKIVDMAALAQ